MVPPLKPNTRNSPVFNGAAAQAAWVNEGHGKTGVRESAGQRAQNQRVHIGKEILPI